MGRRIAVVSGKGGVGKTTIVAGLGLALAKNGYSVCLIDMDVGLNNLDVLLGLENKVNYDLIDCIKGRARIKQALVCDSCFDNLYFMPSVKYGEIDDVSYSEYQSLVSKLASVFDFVLIDAPAGSGAIYNLAVSGAEEILVVVTPNVVSIRDADKIISQIKATEKQVSIVVNRIRGDMVARKEMLSHDQIESLLKTLVIGVIPENDDIHIYSSYKFSKILKDESIVPFVVLARNLKYDKPVIFDYLSRYKGLAGLIRRKLKRSV